MEPCSWLPAPTLVARGRKAGNPRCMPLACQKHRNHGSTASNRMASARTGHAELIETGRAANCYTRVVSGSRVALSQRNQETRTRLQAAGAMFLSCGQYVLVPTASPCRGSWPRDDTQRLKSRATPLDTALARAGSADRASVPDSRRRFAPYHDAVVGCAKRGTMHRTFMVRSRVDAI